MLQLESWRILEYLVFFVSLQIYKHPPSDVQNKYTSIRPTKWFVLYFILSKVTLWYFWEVQPQKSLILDRSIPLCNCMRVCKISGEGGSYIFILFICVLHHFSFTTWYEFKCSIKFRFIVYVSVTQLEMYSTLILMVYVDTAQQYSQW